MHRKKSKPVLIREGEVLEANCHLWRPSLSLDDKNKMSSKEISVYYNLILLQWEMNFVKGKVLFFPFCMFFSYTYVLNFQNNTLFLVLFIQQTPRLYSKLLTDLFSPSLFPPMHSPHSCHCDLSKMQIKNSSSWNPWIDPQGLQNEVGTP